MKINGLDLSIGDSIDSFYALANRSRRGINKTYRVVIKKGGETDYPVLGPETPPRSKKEE